jgi:hypothetical protein
MKKATDKTARRRKLVLRSEAVIVLTPPQLRKVVGGWSDDWPCGGTSQEKQVCENQPI